METYNLMASRTLQIRGPNPVKIRWSCNTRLCKDTREGISFGTRLSFLDHSGQELCIRGKLQSDLALRRSVPNNSRLASLR
jgi:hypothetical protein